MSECYSPISILLGFLKPDSLSSKCLSALYGDTLRYDGSLFSYLGIFALTCLLEFPIYFSVGTYFGRKAKTLLYQTIFLNLATHPLVIWIFPWFGELYQQNMLRTVGTSELFALVVEALLMRLLFQYGWAVAIVTSMAANLASWWIGLYIYS